MSIEDPIKKERELPELSNEDTVFRILESGSDEEMERLRAFHGLTREQMALFRHFLQMRLRVVTAKNQEAAQRKLVNPVATPEELSLGCYREDLEPQVRDAVFLLNRKGYSTQESGFYGVGGQRITFKPGFVADLKFSDQLVKALDEKGLILKMEDGDIVLEYKKPLNLATLNEAWDAVVAEVPEA